MSSPLAASSNTRRQKPSAPATVPLCCGCGTMIDDDVKALQCDKCQSQAWKCIDCLSLTADLYDQLILQPSCALRWYCGSCDCGDRIDKLVSVVQKLMEKFMDMEDKFKTEVIWCSSSRRQDQIPQVAPRVGNDSVMPASSGPIFPEPCPAASPYCVRSAALVDQSHSRLCNRYWCPWY